MSRLRYNNAVGKLGSALTSGGTAIDFGTTAPSFATLVAPDYIPLVIDPPVGSSPNASFEIVYLTAYTAGATTGTISRGQEGTTGVAHGSGATWACSETVADARQLVEAVKSVAASGAAQTIPDVTTDQMTLIELTANCTLTFPAAAAGKRFRLQVQQNDTGAWLITWPSSVVWPSGTAPTLTSTADLADEFEFTCYDGVRWLGRVLGQAYSTGRTPPALTGTTLVRADSGGSTTIAIPATAKVGDLAILAVAAEAFTATPAMPAAPTGWTLQGSSSVTFSAFDNLGVFTHTVATGEPGTNVTVALPANATGMIMRTYTCNGFDSIGFAVSGAGGDVTLARPTALNPTGWAAVFAQGGGTSGTGAPNAPTYSTGSFDNTVQIFQSGGFGDVAAETFHGNVPSGAVINMHAVAVIAATVQLL